MKQKGPRMNEAKGSAAGGRPSNGANNGGKGARIDPAESTPPPAADGTDGQEGRPGRHSVRIVGSTPPARGTSAQVPSPGAPAAGEDRGESPSSETARVPDEAYRAK